MLYFLSGGVLWKRFYNNCCGIDVHKKLLVACFRSGGKQEIRNFGATTREIIELCQWLMDGGCEMVAMESTGSYWKPLYNIIEEMGLMAMVVNARHMKAVPGRKTDVQDAEWIADLLQHGLLRASYIPDKRQRELRELVSYRKSLISEYCRELNRLQKMLEGANIKLSGTVSNIAGKSARAILDYIVEGKAFGEAEYDRMYRDNTIAHNLKATKEQIIDDLKGVMSSLQRKMLKTVLAHIDDLKGYIRELDDDIDNYMKPEEKDAVKTIQSVPGIGQTGAQAIISVIGIDMKRFPTANHISSWAGICPGNNESAGKRLSGKTRKGNSLLKSTLVVCANAAVKVKDSFFHAQYTRICIHRGKKRAIVAVAHSMLVSVYHMLRTGLSFKDLGAQYYNQFNRESKIRACIKKLQELDPNITVTTAV